MRNYMRCKSKWRETTLAPTIYIFSFSKKEGLSWKHWLANLDFITSLIHKSDNSFRILMTHGLQASKVLLYILVNQIALIFA